MAADLGNINAMGVGDQDIRDEEGGNNSRGVFDQVRPTGIMATGGREKSRSRVDMRGSTMDRGGR